MPKDEPTKIASSNPTARPPYLLYGILSLLLLASIIGLVVAFSYLTLPKITIHGWIAMGLGTFFSLLVGFGLMGLAFYSSRQGYDDAADPGRVINRRDP